MKIKKYFGIICGAGIFILGVIIPKLESLTDQIIYSSNISTHSQSQINFKDQTYLNQGQYKLLIYSEKTNRYADPNFNFSIEDSLTSRKIFVNNSFIITNTSWNILTGAFDLGTFTITQPNEYMINFDMSNYNKPIKYAKIEFRSQYFALPFPPILISLVGFIILLISIFKYYKIEYKS